MDHRAEGYSPTLDVLSRYFSGDFSDTAMVSFTPFNGVGYSASGLFPGTSALPTAVPGPITGAGLPGLLASFGAVLAWYQRRRVVAI